jgi:hypothetical protein
MDVRIRVCQACYTKRVAAARLAEDIKKSVGIDVPIEGGYHGQLALLIDGQLVSAPRNSLGHGLPADEIEGFLLNEVRRRVDQAGPVLV